MTDFLARRRLLGLIAAAPALAASGSGGAFEPGPVNEGAAFEIAPHSRGEVSGELVWTDTGRGGAPQVWRPGVVRGVDDRKRIAIVMANPDDRVAFTHAKRLCAAHAGRGSTAMLVAYETLDRFMEEVSRRAAGEAAARTGHGYCVLERWGDVPERHLAEMVRRLSVSNPGWINADEIDVAAVLQGGPAAWQAEFVGLGEDRTEQVLEWIRDELQYVQPAYCRAQAALLTITTGPDFRFSDARRFMRTVREWVDGDDPVVFVFDHEIEPSSDQTLIAQLLVTGEPA